MHELTIAYKAAFAISVTIFLSGPGVAEIQVTAAESFDARQALCDRQTFRLQDLSEVNPWLDYLSGLRTGQTTPPDPNKCGSSTLRQIFAALTDTEMAPAHRHALVMFYASSAMDPDSFERHTDQSGHFRYLNDLTAASLLWLVCPSEQGRKSACFEPVISGLADTFLMSSPVFCDFSETPTPELTFDGSSYADLPGLCSAAATRTKLHEDWLNSFSQHMEGG